MRRRDFIKAFAGSATWPLAARAQQRQKIPRIGVMLYAKQEQGVISPFLRGLEALGHVDGKTVVIEYRDADGKAERLQQAANDLVDLKPDVIFSQGGDPAPFVKRATTTIPIVVVGSSDPVASGLLTSLGRPGGNITEVTYAHDMVMPSLCGRLEVDGQLEGGRLLHRQVGGFGALRLSRGRTR